MRKWMWGLIATVVAAVITALATVLVPLLDNGKEETASTDAEANRCPVIGNSAPVEVNCPDGDDSSPTDRSGPTPTPPPTPPPTTVGPESPAVPEPRVDVIVVGPGQWAFDARLFNGNASLGLVLRDPQDRVMPLGRYATMRTDPDGARRTEGVWWEYAKGEPTGFYTLSVTGQDQSSDTVTVEDRFYISGELPADPVTS